MWLYCSSTNVRQVSSGQKSKEAQVPDAANLALQALWQVAEKPAGVWANAYLDRQCR